MKRSDIQIRPEAVGDRAAIHQVQEMAFGQPAEANLVDALRSAGKAVLSLVAERGGRVVGHILFSPVTIETPAGLVAGLGLAPVGVLPDLQRQGIGSALIEAGLEECRRRGAPFVVVLGEPEYYARFGFLRARALGLNNEYGADEEFRVIELQPGGLPSGGLVRYAPEFAEVT